MGGDFAPEATVLGAIEAQKELKENAKIFLIGDEKSILDILKREAVSASLFGIIPTTEVIEMQEHPAKAFRRKQQSSIAVGFKMLQDGELDAFASAGNSGAMLVGSMYTIKPIAGVIRPCITSVLPKENGGVGVLLDVGINADCKPDVLYQFAVLGSMYAEFVYGIKQPRVGLMNIGEEKEKGNMLTQAANSMMRETKDFNFIGNIEGRDMLSDDVELVLKFE